jgi:hypothetical protein
LFAFSSNEKKASVERSVGLKVVEDDVPLLSRGSRDDEDFDDFDEELFDELVDVEDDDLCEDDSWIRCFLRGGCMPLLPPLDPVSRFLSLPPEDEPPKKKKN